MAKNKIILCFIPLMGMQVYLATGNCHVSVITGKARNLLYVSFYLYKKGGKEGGG